MTESISHSEAIAAARVLLEYLKGVEHVSLGDGSPYFNGEDPHDACQVLAKKYGLTKRETEVFEVQMYGYATKVIAMKLYIAQDTVRNHIKSVRAKTDCHSADELVDLVAACMKDSEK